jgi:hypothetical protein
MTHSLNTINIDVSRCRFACKALQFGTGGRTGELTRQGFSRRR